MALKIKSDQTILFIGDSITDCGRMGSQQPLGDGYVKLFRDLLISREPEKKVFIINKGISGNKVFQLRDRWADDVLQHRPDWLSVMIGINDLHANLLKYPEAMTPERFAQIYDDLLRETKTKLPGCKMLLLEPYYISQDRLPHSFRKRVLDFLPQYITAVHALSRKYKTRLVKTHELFQKLLKYYEADIFAGDCVHANVTGHLVMAEAVYKALS